MRKLWLTFTAMLLCSIASFAQTRDAENRIIINSPEEFLKIGTTGYSISDSYILTDNINLGDRGTLTEAVIPTFSGTFDGDRYTIKYTANFNGSEEDGKYGLFGNVTGTGTIKNLNLEATATLVGSAIDMNIGLLCGYIDSNGKIEYCNVTGNINSAVNSSNGGGTDAGLVAGQCYGKISYCIVSGNVTGIGYVGGIVGQLGDVWYNNHPGGDIIACSFSGTVNADNTRSSNDPAMGSFGAGICGMADNNSTIQFCVANADITAEKACNGISSTIVSSSQWWQRPAGSPDVTNSYANGNVNETAVNDNTITNTSGVREPNYYKGEMPAQDIVDELNDAIPEEEQDKFYFDVINGEVVLIIGQRAVICNAPTNLQVNITGSTATITWVAPEGATQFRVSKGGGVIISGSQPTLTTSTVEGNSCTMSPIQQGGSYIVKVETICGNDSYSEPVSISFTRDCPSIRDLAVNNITHETATATWSVSEGTTFRVRLYVGNNTNSQHIREEETNSLTTINLSELEPATQYTIEVLARCGGDDIEGNNATATFTTKPVNFETAQSGNFNDPNTWEGNVVPSGNVANITINTGHRVTVSHNLVITGSYKIIDNNGVLEITQQGQLINTTGTNVLGIVEIVTPQKSIQAWTFIGAPFQTGYKLGCILPESHDVSVKKYDYKDGNATPGWSDSWAHIGTTMKAGEGYFAYPFYNGVIDFTTYGDVGTYEDRGNGYTSTNTVTSLNNEDVTVTETIAQSNNGYWMALSNPYPAKLKASKFVSDNGGNAVINGNCVYVFKNGAFDMPSNDEIEMTGGFFVNFSSTGEKTITFKKGQLSYNNQSKASANEFIKLTLINGNKKVRAYLAHNENAEQGYDIFDANKLFAPTEIAEPYFVTDGIALMKEEFAELPYYATMNVRSFANDTVSFVVNNIPEGLAVSIIDGENVIDMVEGGVYTTEILTGENADRFKVLIKKSVSISDVEELEVNITNNNRHISIETTETDLQVEVYNALGQKVLSTKDRNFTLNQVSAGAYLIKAFNNKASKTQKIVVE